MTDYRNFIEEALKKAVPIANKHFGKVANVSKKEGDNNQVLTDADLEIGALLVSEVEKEFPKYNVIDEEAGVIDKQSEYTWVIDPVDGTSNFAVGLPTYGVMIGLLENDTPIAGGIALPAFNEILLAQKGRGAFVSGQPIMVDTASELEDALVVYMIDGHPEKPELTRAETKTMSEIILKIRNLRTTGSAFDIAAVAKGSYGGLLNQTSKIWDNVAPQAIIEEAGGIYTDFWGQPMNYSNPLDRADDNYSQFAAAPQIHAALTTILAEHAPEPE